MGKDVNSIWCMCVCCGGGGGRCIYIDIYINIYTYVYMYIYIFIHVYIYTCIHIYKNNIHTCEYSAIFARILPLSGGCTCVCMWVCAYVCVCGRGKG